VTAATPILELRSVRGTGGGPEKTILLGTSQIDAARYPTTVCYLRDARDPVFEIDARAHTAGVEYIEVVERHSFDWRVWPALRQIVRHRRIRIVHAHDYKTDLLALLLSRVEGVTALATAHGWTGRSAREQWIYYPIDKRVLRRFSKVIAVSEQLRQDLLGAGLSPDRVVTLLNGIDHRMFRRDFSREPSIRARLGLRSQDVVLGAVGRLEPQKRFDILLDAFAQLSKSRPDLRLLIAGEGGLRDALQSQAARLGIEDTCRLLGLRSDIADLHHAFQLFVQSSDYEGTPNAVLEAMAMETPIVATGAGGTAEIARPGIEALIVPPSDTSALIAGIEQALGDHAGARDRAIRARQRIETRLSFEARMAALERIYDELASNGGTRSPAGV
jgi:glycosyltransferase involved in cell wall biosynthesis